MEAELETMDLALRIQVFVRDAQDAIPRCLSAIGQDGDGTHLLVLRTLARPHEDQGVIGIVLREERRRREEQCEALYGSIFDSGEMDAIGNPWSAAELMADYFKLQFDAERDRPRPSQVDGAWEGYFEPYQLGRRLTIVREVGRDLVVSVGEFGNGWACWSMRAPTSSLDVEPDSRYPYLWQAFEAAIRIASEARRPASERLPARESRVPSSRRINAPFRRPTTAPGQEVLEHVWYRRRR